MTELPPNSWHPGTWAEQTPDKPAVIMLNSGDATTPPAQMTYAELEDAANRLSRLFFDAGLRPGDHIAFCMENRIE